MLLVLILSAMVFCDLSSAAVTTCDVTCGSQCYDPNKKHCCGETLIDIRMTSRIGCCNGTIYNHREHTCCGSSLIAAQASDWLQSENDRPRKSITSNQRCCGEKHIYDVTTELCCTDVVRRRRVFNGNGPNGEPTYTEAQCCGNSTYDETSEVCCENDLFPATQFNIRRKQPGRHYACCQSRVYDIESEECNDADVTDRNEIAATTTCGSSNSQDQICCNGVYFSLAIHGPDTQCCGSSIHDASRSLCCNNRIINVTTGNEMCCPLAPLGYVNSTTHLCCGSRPHLKRKSSSSNTDVIVCCGSEAIDVTRQGCCHDDGLTGATPYIKERQRCCGGLVTSTNTSCCANRWPITGSDVCCPLSGPVARQRRGDNACCESRFSDSMAETTRSTYNSEREVCHDGTVVDRILMAQCDGRPYNTVTHICCSDTTRQGRRRTTAVLFERQTENDACCGDQLFDPRRQLCRQGIIRNTRDSMRRSFYVE